MSHGGRPKRDDITLLNRTAELWGEERQEEIGYLARVFTQTALPYRDPGNMPEWRRRNSGLTLTVQPGPTTYDPKTGQDQPTRYPFGAIPRLLLVWMSTEAVRTGQRVLRLGESLSDFMRQLDLAIGGTNIRRLRDQTIRLISARITIGYSENTEIYQRQAAKHLSVASSYDLWWSAKSPMQSTLMPSYVELTEEFFREVTTRPVPGSLDALKELRGSPMHLDIYVWLTYRMSYLSQPTKVSWDSLMFQFGSGATSERGRRQFRTDFLSHLGQVLAIYREARVTPEDGGLLLHPSPPHVSRRRALNT